MTPVKLSSLVLLLTILPGIACSATAADPPANLRLTLPTEFYAVAGQEMSVYFDNVVLTETPEKYRFKVQCDIGKSEDRRWSVRPGQDDVGTHDFSITVRDASGQQLQSANAKLHVIAADAGAGKPISLLIVGDSLTHATAYPNELARLLSLPGNPTWKMLGTHVPSSATEGVRHEGYGGWTWSRFATHYEPNPDGTYRKRSSPFVFLGDDQKPQLDVARYFNESAKNQRPDVVFFLLGINDCFSAGPDDPAAIDAKIDAMFEHADTLLAEFRKVAPDADLAICVTTPPNARESGFEANYKGRYHRWGWKRIQHRLVERQLARFQQSPEQSRKRQPHLFLVPTQLNLDPVDGYPVNNGVHPNTFGYQQIGGSLYAWLKWRMSQQ
jgi:lysophospholipase L1-like esterase